MEYAIGTIAAAFRHPVHGDHGRFHRHRVDQHHQPGVEHHRLADEAGGVTVEVAFAIAAPVVVFMRCVSRLTASLGRCPRQPLDAGHILVHDASPYLP